MMYNINYTASKNYNVNAMVCEPAEKWPGNSILQGQAVTSFADEDGTEILSGGLMFMFQGPKSELERLLKDEEALRERVQYYLAEVDEMTPEEAEEVQIFTLFGLMIDDTIQMSLVDSKQAIVDGAKMYHEQCGGFDPSDTEGFKKLIDTIDKISEKEILYAEMMEVDDALRECGQMPYEESEASPMTPEEENNLFQEVADHIDDYIEQTLSEETDEEIEEIELKLEYGNGYISYSHGRGCPEIWYRKTKKEEWIHWNNLSEALKENLVHWTLGIESWEA